MAKRKESQTQAAQIPLIDVEHPMYKPFKALRRKMGEIESGMSESRAALKACRGNLIALFKEHNVKPDVDGVMRIVFDDGLVEIAPGESKIYFKDKPKPVADEEAEDGGTGE